MLPKSQHKLSSASASSTSIPRLMRQHDTMLYRRKLKSKAKTESN